MQSVIDEQKKPGLTNRMIDECGLLETDRSIEEDEESLECQERIIMKASSKVLDIALIVI